MLADSAATGAPLHIVHLNSSTDESVRDAMELIRAARNNGVNVTTEAYPYTAGSPLLELSDMPWPGSSSLKDRFENIPKERIQIYAQGASLAIYLITHRPEAFKAFLEELAGPSRSHTASSRWRAAFKDAFGDVDALESDWKRWLLALEPAS